MDKRYIKEEKEFLSDVSIDYVSLHNIFGIIAGGFDRDTPNEKEFGLIIKFIMFLFNKYGNLLTYSSGPGNPINKNIHELVKYLELEYNKGNYYDLSYSIWFDLDESVIPKEYLPKPMEDGET